MCDGARIDVEASRAIRQAEVGAARTMINRARDRFDIYPERLAADTAHGTAEMHAVGWTAVAECSRTLGGDELRHIRLGNCLTGEFKFRLGSARGSGVSAPLPIALQRQGRLGWASGYFAFVTG